MNPMADMKVPVEVDPNEDTEWNDILRSHGIIPEKPPSPTAQLEEALDEAIQKQQENRLENKELDELDALEDDEDEEFLNFYKTKRLNELQSLQSRAKFGTVSSISKNEYEKEITQASKEAVVVVHLSSDAMLQSRLLGSLFHRLAGKFPEIKFVDIPAHRAIEHYPDTNIPTLLIYKGGNVLRQFITLMELGGNSTNLKDMEKVMMDLGVIDFSDRRAEVNEDREEGEETGIRDDSDGDFYD